MRTWPPTVARAGVAVTWGTPSTSRGPAVVVVDARTVVTGMAVVVVAGSTVDVTGTVGAVVGTGPSVRAPSPEHAPRIRRPRIDRCRLMSVILARRRHAGISVS